MTQCASRPDWLDCAGEIHNLYKELLSVGNSIMRIEDHLTMQIPGADLEMKEAQGKLLAMVAALDRLLSGVAL